MPMLVVDLSLAHVVRLLHASSITRFRLGITRSTRFRLRGSAARKTKPCSSVEMVQMMRSPTDEEELPAPPLAKGIIRSKTQYLLLCTRV